jgi:hypothetical protein
VSFDNRQILDRIFGAEVGLGESFHLLVEVRLRKKKQNENEKEGKEKGRKTNSNVV